MEENNSDLTGIRAYFSHSYRILDKHINLYFWDLFSKKDCYFTVDQKPDNDAPMDITYLEWLMRNSDYFIAVIPYRNEPNSPGGCSPYQAFELALAKRADKPSLIFAETGLQDDLFEDFEVCFFSRAIYKNQEARFVQAVERLLAKTRAKRVSSPKGKKKVAVIAEKSDIYTDDLERVIRNVAQINNFKLGKTLHPSIEFEDESGFISKMKECEILISETRWPHIPLDLFTIPHMLCIPTIPICYLQEGETEDQVAGQMKLSIKESEWGNDVKGNTLNILKRYQVDERMRPVIFWRNQEDLTRELNLRLEKMDQVIGRAELRSSTMARQYFLKIGRGNKKVFISNSSSVNPFAEKLAQRFKDEAIDRFHYMDFNAIPIGTPNWWEHVRAAIEESEIFVVLINEPFLESRWCQEELKFAMERFYNGCLQIYPYILDQMEWPDELGLIEGKNLSSYSEEEKFEKILASVVAFLEDANPFPQRRLNFNEIQISYSDQLKHIDVMSQIEKPDKNWEETLELPSDLIDFARKASINERMWSDSIETVGNVLYKELFSLPEINRRYQVVRREVSFDDENVRFRFLTDKDGFRIPFEWMKTEEDGDPICLLHPVYRKIMGISDFRPPLNRIARNEMSMLLVASNTGGIPNVENEIEDLKNYFLETCKIQEKNICTLHTLEATEERIRDEISGGKYHLFHFAGHGSREEQGRAYIQVLSSNGETVKVDPVRINEWINSSSSLRFVYMSSCSSVEITGKTKRAVSTKKYRRTLDLLEAIVKAKVPDTIGFHLPVNDSESYQLALAFYRNYFNGFDAAHALYKVRYLFSDTDAKIWAAPLLIQQR